MTSLATTSETMPLTGLYPRAECFACGSVGVPFRRFLYREDQLGFVPEPYLSKWCRTPATLMRCRACGSQWPRVAPGPDLLEAWYRAQDYATVERQSGGHVRAAAYLAQLPRGSLIDVGCGSGAFLDLLPGTWKAWGLEPSMASRQAGECAGRRVMCPNSHGWSDGLPQHVDVVTLFDVVEHLFDPALILRRLLQHLSPEGVLVIFTGNAGSKFARRQGSAWWYHGWAGHISCFSKRGIVQLLNRLEADPIHFEELSYEALPIRPSLMRRSYWALGSLLGRRDLVDACHSSISSLLRLFRTALHRLGNPAIANGPIGADHMLIVARRSRAT